MKDDAATLADDVLRWAQSGREVVQDFVPLGESLEWELGQQYLRERGNKAFTSDASPVPFVINNDGSLSRQAAEVFFANCVSAEKAGTLERDVFVLELGIGVGLFARFFLDAFRDLCLERKKDYYERLCYIAADKSERMLLDVLRHGVLDDHPGKFRVRPVDAMAPEADLASDVLFRKHPDAPIRAVFLNYLLDCLPAASIEVDGDEVRQLCVRTCVARTVRLADSTDLTPQQLRQRSASKDAKSRQELLEVYGLFASEYDYRPVDPKTLPYGEFACETARRTSKRLLHNYGAIRSLEKLLNLLTKDGFILINDYGQTQTARDDEFEHQRFSFATAVGLNFPLLRAYFEGPAQKHWVEPSGDARGIHSRLMGHRIDSETIAAFYGQFDDARHAWRQEPLEKARLCVRSGRFELASNFYREALKRQPYNWVLVNELSMFLTYQMHDPKSGIDMAKLALRINPSCSADLWSTLGDALYEFGRVAEAKSAYFKALDINASDVRARFNLAWVYAREKDFAAALVSIAEAIAADKSGQFRDRLLQKQQEVIAQLQAKNQQEHLLLTNLVSKYSKNDAKPEAEPLPVPQHSE